MKGVLYILCLIVALGVAPGVQGQSVTAGKWAWKPLFTHEGVEFFYIFYNKANNEDNGVVILLTNTNGYAVDYQFKAVFKSGTAEAIHEARGRLEPGESKTGDSDGLFWVPFMDGREIEQVGLRGYKVTPVRSRMEPAVQK